MIPCQRAQSEAIGISTYSLQLNHRSDGQGLTRELRENAPTLYCSPRPRAHNGFCLQPVFTTKPVKPVRRFLINAAGVADTPRDVACVLLLVERAVRANVGPVLALHPRGTGGSQGGARLRAHQR